MSCADRSQSGRLRRLKGKVNAAFANSEGFTSFGISKTPSTRLSVEEGRRDVVAYDHYANETITNSGCCDALAQIEPLLVQEVTQVTPTNVTVVPGAEAGTIDVSWTGTDSSYLVSAGDQFVIGPSPVTFWDLTAGATYTITIGQISTTITI
jgi:hypothetical protein